MGPRLRLAEHSASRGASVSAQGKDAPEAVVATILEHQGDGSGETLPCFSLGAALAVGAGDLRAEGDHPIAVALVHGSELVVHDVLTRRRVCAGKMVAAGGAV